MKKHLFFLLCALVASTSISLAWDYERVQIGDLYYNLDATEQTAEVTSQNSENPYWKTQITTAEIPASFSYNDALYSVTSIGGRAFYECSSLTSVSIPSSVASIGNIAFYKCSNLTSMVIEEGNTEYDSRDNCNAIIETATNTLVAGCQNTIIPNDVTSIGNSAFSDCTSLTSMTIPNSVTSIGDAAFSDCSGLTSMTIGYNVKRIGEHAFRNCSGLTSVTIPSSVISIGYAALHGCTSLTSISVETGNTKYDSRDNCNAIIETATNTLIRSCQNTVIPSGVESIGYEAFENCSIISIEIPNSVTSIGQGAFSGCTGLTSVAIPNSVTSIGDLAFDKCRSWTSVTIPNSVTSIGDNAFRNCIGLTTMFVEAGNTVYDSRDNCNAIIETASNTLVFGCQNTIIPNSVTKIGQLAFINCSSLASVNIPYGVTSIGESAFSWCTGLTSVNIANTVKSIGEWAFYHCDGLTSVTIPSGVTSIGARAFSWCSNLTSITCKATTPPSLGDGIFEEGVDKSIPLYVPEESIELYREAQGWNEFLNIKAYVPPTVTIFGEDVVITDPEDGTVVVDEVDILGDSTLVYTPEDNTLTITNAQIEAGDSITAVISYTGSEPLTIVLCDSSTIIADTIISSTSDIIITGSGTLVAEGVVPIIGTEDATITFDSVNMVVQSLPNPAAVRRRIRGGKRLDETGGPALSGFGNADFNKVEVTPPAALYGAVTPDDSPSLTDAIMALYVPNADGSKQVLTGFTLTAVADDHSAVEIVSQDPTTLCTKIIRNGQLFIQRGDKTYTVQGTEVR